MQTLIHLAADKPRLSAPPGAADTLLVTVRNLSSLLDQVTLRVEGVPADWVQVAPPHLPVFAQSEAVAQITFRPARDPSVAQAGIYPLRILADAAEHPGQEDEAAAELEVQLVGEYRLSLEAGAVPAPAGERCYRLRVQNAANAALRLRLAGSDGGNALLYKFEPFEVSAGPGRVAVSDLSVRGRQAAAGVHDVLFDAVAQGAYQLRGGGEIAAPEQRVVGQYSQAAWPRLGLSLRPLPGTDPTAALFEVTVANPAAAAITVQLDARGDGADLALELRPAALSLPAQDTGRSTLVVRGPAPEAGQEGERSFTVTAVPSGHAQPATVSGSLAAAGRPGPAPAPPARPLPLWLAVAAVLLFLIVVLLMISIWGRP